MNNDNNRSMNTTRCRLRFRTRFLILFPVPEDHNGTDMSRNDGASVSQIISTEWSVCCCMASNDVGRTFHIILSEFSKQESGFNFLISEFGMYGTAYIASKKKSIRELVSTSKPLVTIFSHQYIRINSRFLNLLKKMFILSCPADGTRRLPVANSKAGSNWTHGLIKRVLLHLSKQKYL